jgi:hypothetical protein
MLAIGFGFIDILRSGPVPESPLIPAAVHARFKFGEGSR